MTTKRNVVRLKNGKFVEEWQYSQGNFDVEETTDLNSAVNVSKSNFITFFKDDGAEFLRLTTKTTLEKIILKSA